MQTKRNACQILRVAKVVAGTETPVTTRLALAQHKQALRGPKRGCAAVTTATAKPTAKKFDTALRGDGRGGGVVLCSGQPC